ITLLGGAAAAWPLAARAQPAKTMGRIGVLGPGLSNPFASTLYQAFLAQLRELGFSEGQNLVAEYQAMDDARGPFVATIELMRSQPDLVVPLGPEVALQAVVGASGSVPIVFIAVNYDPIARGYVMSVARPGGNITGVFFRQLELAGKQVELLAQAFPDRPRIAVFFDGLSADQFSAAERTATSLNLHIQALRLENPPYDFEAVFRNAKAGAAQAVLVLSSPFFVRMRPKLANWLSSTTCRQCLFRSWVVAHAAAKATEATATEASEAATAAPSGMAARRRTAPSRPAAPRAAPTAREPPRRATRGKRAASPRTPARPAKASKADGDCR